MTTTTIAQGAPDQYVEQPWRPFHVRVKALQRLSPTFVRVTFTGGDLDQMGHDGPDQRVKVYLPARGGSLPDFSPENWYTQYRAADPATRGAVRTYTIGAVRPERREVDIDFALHGESGPASRWALDAEIGDEIALVGPNRLFPGDCQGYEWKLPAAANTVLIAGDETAVPAIARILDTMCCTSASTMRRPRNIQVVLEVPSADDIIELPVPAGADITWLIRERDGQIFGNGELLVEGVRKLDLDPPVTEDGSSADTIDLDLELIWEVAENGAADDEFYAWVAGEAGAVKAIRRYLVRERNVPKGCVTFMGYWRLGRAEIN